MKIKLHLEGNKNMTHNQEKESFKILLSVVFQRERNREIYNIWFLNFFITQMK